MQLLVEVRYHGPVCAVWPGAFELAVERLVNLLPTCTIAAQGTVHQE